MNAKSAVWEVKSFTTEWRKLNMRKMHIDNRKIYTRGPPITFSYFA